MKKVLPCLLFFLWIIMGARLACGDDDAGKGLFLVYFGPYMYHFSPNAEHNNFPWFVGAEWETASLWEVGGAVFSNSYYQPSGYVYGGKRWIYGPEESHWYLKLTAGAILGYVEPYEDKIPVNWNGIGLGIIPAIGYKYKRVSTQLAILGVSALMVTFGYDIWNEGR